MVKQTLLVILTDLLMFSNNALRTAVYKHGILTYVNHLNQYIIEEFKEILEIETYLTIDLPYSLRKVLANFRCSGHSLMIKKGRHQNIERNLRFCKLCLKRNVYSIEDEFHLFCVCPFYKDFRDLYFKPQWNKDIITINMFYTIMSQTDKHSIMSISRF